MGFGGDKLISAQILLCFVSLGFDLPTVWMAWGAGNEVGLNKSLFPIYYHLLCPFL